MKLPIRLALAAAFVLTLTTPLSASPIGRDADPANPVKVIRRVVVWILDELGVPRP